MWEESMQRKADGAGLVEAAAKRRMNRDESAAAHLATGPAAGSKRLEDRLGFPCAFNPRRKPLKIVCPEERQPGVLCVDQVAEFVDAAKDGARNNVPLAETFTTYSWRVVPSARSTRMGSGTERSLRGSWVKPRVASARAAGAPAPATAPGGGARRARAHRARAPGEPPPPGRHRYRPLVRGS